MNIDEDALSCGQYLKSMRLAKGVSLEEISRETRIGKDLLLSIENGDDASLPAEAFVKGFLRAYSGTIGIDGQEAVRRYLAERPHIQAAGIVPPGLRTPPRRRLWPMLAAVFGALGLLVLFSIYLTTGSPPPPSTETDRAASQRQPAAEAASPKSASQDAGAPAAAPGDAAAEETAQRPPSVEEGVAPPAQTENALPSPGPDSAENPAAADPRKLTLEIAAREETWMKIIVDGGKPKEYTLFAGGRIALEGEAAFNLLIGNAGGVDLRFNGRPVDPAGKRGQVVTLQFP